MSAIKGREYPGGAPEWQKMPLRWYIAHERTTGCEAKSHLHLHDIVREPGREVVGGDDTITG